MVACGGSRPRRQPLSTMDFSNIDPRNTFYKRLMLDQSADAEVIQTVYRRLARRYHPDVDRSPQAERRMAALNEAYAVLRDPALRARYDAALAALAARRDRRATDGQARPYNAGPVPYNGGPVPMDSRQRSTDGEPAATHGEGSAPGSRYGEAGVPEGPPVGSVLEFGRYRGWTLGQIRRRDPDFLEWLVEMPIGRVYRQEIATLLRRSA